MMLGGADKRKNVVLALGELLQVPFGNRGLRPEHGRLVNVDRGDENKAPDANTHEAIDDLILRSTVHKRWQVLVQNDTPTHAPHGRTEDNDAGCRKVNSGRRAFGRFRRTDCGLATNRGTVSRVAVVA